MSDRLLNRELLGKLKSSIDKKVQVSKETFNGDMRRSPSQHKKTKVFKDLQTFKGDPMNATLTEDLLLTKFFEKSLLPNVKLESVASDKFLGKQVEISINEDYDVFDAIAIMFKGRNSKNLDLTVKKEYNCITAHIEDPDVKGILIELAESLNGTFFASELIAKGIITNPQTATVTAAFGGEIGGLDRPSSPESGVPPQSTVVPPLKTQHFGESELVDECFYNPSGYSCKLIINDQSALEVKEIGFFKKEEEVFCKVNNKDPLLIKDPQILPLLSSKFSGQDVSNTNFTEEERSKILMFLSAKCHYIPPLPYATHAAAVVYNARNSAVADYRAHRENGIDVDNPARQFPQDGEYIWEKPYGENRAKVRYTEGQKDKEWMEEKDSNCRKREAAQPLVPQLTVASGPVLHRFRVRCDSQSHEAPWFGETRASEEEATRDLANAGLAGHRHGKVTSV